MENLLVTFEFLIYAYFLSLVGRQIFKRFNIYFDEPIEKFGYLMVAGYSATAVAGFVLAVFGAFNLVWLLILAALAIGFSVAIIRSDINALKKFFTEKPFIKIRGFFSNNTTFKIILVLWLAVNFVILFVPVTAGDAINYHLPIMRDIIEKGKIVSPVAGIAGFGNLPVLVELSYGIPTLIFGNAGAPFVFQFLQYLSMLLIMVLAVSFVKKRAVNLNWTITALFILSIFDLEWGVTDIGLIDCMAALFIVTAVLLTIESVEKRLDKKKFYLAAFILGVALSAKYYALFAAPAVFAIIIISLLRQKFSFREILKYLVLYFLPVFLVCGYWYGKNFVSFLNPFYPMLNSNYFSDAIHESVPDQTIFKFIIFPFYVYSEKFYSAGGSLSKLIVSGYFFFVYCSGLFFFLKNKKERFDLGVYMLFLAVETYLCLIFFLSFNSRFMIAAAVFGAMLAAIALNRIIEIIRSRPDRGKIFLKTVYGLLIVLFLALFVGNLHFFKDRFYLFSGKITEGKYISDRIGKLYYMSLYIDQHLTNEKVAIIWPSQPYTTLTAYYLSNGNSYVGVKTNVSDDDPRSLSWKNRIMREPLTVNYPENYFILSGKEKSEILNDKFPEGPPLLALENSLLKQSSLVYSYNEGEFSYNLYKINK